MLMLAVMGLAILADVPHLGKYALAAPEVKGCPFAAADVRDDVLYLARAASVQVQAVDSSSPCGTEVACLMKAGRDTQIPAALGVEINCRSTPKAIFSVIVLTEDGITRERIAEPVRTLNENGRSALTNTLSSLLCKVGICAPAGTGPRANAGPGAGVALTPASEQSDGGGLLTANTQAQPHTNQTKVWAGTSALVVGVTLATIGLLQQSSACGGPLSCREVNTNDRESQWKTGRALTVVGSGVGVAGLGLIAWHILE